MNIIPQIYNNTASCETDISTVSIIPHLSTSQQSNDSFQITDEPMDMVSPPCCGNKEALQGGRILGSKLSAHTLSFDDIMLLHTL